MSKKTSLFSDPAAPVFLLVSETIRRIPDWSEIEEPSLIQAELRNLFPDTTNNNLDKVLVGIQMLINPHFYTEPDVFTQFCRMCANKVVDASVFSPLDYEDMVVGLVTYYALNTRDPEPDWDTDVAAYAGLVADNYGFDHPPTRFTWMIMPPQLVHNTTGLDLAKDEATNELIAGLLSSWLDKLKKYLPLAEHCDEVEQAILNPTWLA